MLFCNKFMQEASLERSKDHEKHRLAHRWVQEAQAMCPSYLMPLAEQ